MNHSYGEKMLSEREKEYLKNKREFEIKYGKNYAKVVRSRIRKRVERAIDDMILVMKHDVIEGREVEIIPNKIIVKLIEEYLKYNKYFSVILKRLIEGKLH